MECVDIFCLGKETFLLGVGLEAFFLEIKKKKLIFLMKDFVASINRMCSY
jgi:hypothetical protein